MTDETCKSVTLPRVCRSCPLRSGCPKLANLNALGYCQEASIYFLFAVVIALEIKLLF